MIEQSALASDPSVRVIGAAPRRRTLIWTILFATLASLVLWALIAMAASALLRNLFAT
jgi:hypothetical protein